MILVWFIVILLVGGLLALLAGLVNRNLCRWIALATVLANFVLVVAFWISNPTGGSTINNFDTNSWITAYRSDWIPPFGISFHLALDGLSLLLLMLTFFLGAVSVLCSWEEIKERIGFYYFNLLWILAGITGVFVAMDLFLFYFFWELMLIPMYFLIGIWGSGNRVYAAIKFFIFTQASGLLMLLAILGLYFVHGQNTGNYTFGYFALLGTDLSANVALWLMLGFMIAFAVKLPVFPFHTWLPDAHGEAPTAGSLILAGLLLKTGAYGMMRFAVPLFPEAAASIAEWAMLLGVIGIIYGAIQAYSQTDLKRLVAYTSVSHMGFVILGVFAFNELAVQGVVMQLLTHGISTGALFLIAGMLKERLHTRDLDQMGGLWGQMPAMGGVTVLFAMASLGLPGLGNFIAEFLILMGSFDVNVWITVAGTLGLIFSAIYSLRIVQKIFLEQPARERAQTRDLSIREGIALAVLSLSVAWLGVYPQAVIDAAKPMVDQFTSVFASADDRDRIPSETVSELKIHPLKK
ncbi:MAG TPA: NADH-quinone oxidoreductase subunit M [Sphingobacteriaceae bacterium]